MYIYITELSSECMYIYYLLLFPQKHISYSFVMKVLSIYIILYFYKYYLAIFVRKVRQSVCFSFGPRTVLLLRIRVGPSIHTTSNM